MKSSQQIYQWCLRLYPRAFRDEYGQEMSQLFQDRAAERGRIRLWLQVLGDLLIHAPHEHWSMAKQDVRYALRSWRRAPAVPAIALTALALGMGANIAIFSVMHGVLLRPLPLPEPERLVVLRETSASRGIDATAVSFPNYRSWKEQAGSLDLAAFSGQSLTWATADYPERLEALAPTESFLQVLAAPLHAGRWFTAEEGRLGQHRVTVLSYRLWRARFAEDRGAIGRTMMLNGAPYTIVGIASADMVVPSAPDLWVPQVADPAGRRDNRYLSVIGRLRPGFTRAQAQSELAVIAAGLEREFPDSNAGYRVSLTPLTNWIVPDEIRTALVVLMAAATMVLLIACANVANVLLSRAVGRRREIAIRTAIGAAGPRLARQLLTESLLLSAVGATLGLAAASVIVGASRRGLVGVVPKIEDVALDVPVLAFALALALLTGIAFGLAPLWQVRRARSLDLLHATGWGDHAPSRNRIRAVLIGGQVALTTVLLVGGALLIQSLLKLQNVPTGIDASSVVTAKMALTRARLANGAAIGEFLSRLTSDLQGAPGVSAAGVSSAIPLSPGAMTITRVASDVDPFVTCEWRLVDAGYFRTLRIAVLRGRLFEPHDGAGSPRVFVISQQTARALYGEQDPVGRRLRLENGSVGEVIGVVADVRMRNLADLPERVVYFPPSQFGFFPLFNVIVRTEGRPEAMASVIRERLAAHDANLAAFEIQTMRHWVDRSASLMRIRTRLVTLLGALALLLGVVGIYGVMSYLVAQRTREFGIRVALGARPWALPLGVVGQGLRYTLPGVTIGLVAAMFLGDRIRNLLFEVSADDPATYAAVGALVLVVTVAASWLPARRAAKADPLVVLRAE